MSFMLGAAAKGAENESKSKAKAKTTTEQLLPASKPKVIYVEITGSRIPQRVVISGQQVNSDSPLMVYAGDDLKRSGATNVIGILSIDPSITRRVGRP